LVDVEKITATAQREDGYESDDLDFHVGHLVGLESELQIRAKAPDGRQVLEFKTLVVVVAEGVRFRIEVGILRKMRCVVPKVAAHKRNGQSLEGRLLEQSVRQGVSQADFPQP